MVGRFVNNELERMQKEVVVAELAILSCYLSGQENHEDFSVRIVGVPPKI
jgi:hypothetical protein